MNKSLDTILITVNILIVEQEKTNMELLNARCENAIQDEIEIITDSTFEDAIKYGNIPELIYGIAGIPIDPFRYSMPCWTKYLLPEIKDMSKH